MFKRIVSFIGALRFAAWYPAVRSADRADSHLKVLRPLDLRLRLRREKPYADIRKLKLKTR